MEADGSHDPSELKVLMDAVEGFDMVVGSRYVDGGRAVYDSRFRYWLSRISNQFNRIILGMPFSDVTCDYRCYRVESLRMFDLKMVESGGFVFGVEMLYRLVKAGFKVAEVPVTFRERSRGQSKTDFKVILSYPLEVLKMKRGVSG